MKALNSERQINSEKKVLDLYDTIHSYSLYEQLVKNAQKSENKIIIEDDNDNEFTFSDLLDKINRVSAFLKDTGIDATDTVAICLPNSAWFIISLFSCFQLGIRATLINNRLTETEVQFQLNDANATVIITNNELRKRFSKLFSTHVFKLRIIVDEVTDSESKELNGDYILFNSIIDNSEIFSDNVSMPESVALLLYTGGTTSIPKAVMLTHANLLANALQFNYALDTKKRDPNKSKVLAILPFYHSFGLMCSVLSPLFKGHKLIIQSKFNPHNVWDTLINKNITEIYAVPTMYIAMLQNLPTRLKDISLSIAVSGGSALPTSVSKRFFEVVGVKISEGYGLTECSPVTHVNPIDSPKTGSIGLPLLATDAKIIDIETNHEINETNKRGELVIKGPQVMLGYYNKALETLRTFTSDGYLKTGDIAMKDKDGYYYIVDRLKDIINSGGLKIYPREVEEVVYKLPEVKYAALIGIPDNYYGEVGKLFVVKKEGTSLNERDILIFLSKYLAKYKIPKEIEFVKELPLSGAGKVLKRELKKGVLY